jgi:NAD-specific glutamate dehydrogenase
MPFLLDTVSINLTRMGIGVHVFGHPVVRFSRDRNGRISDVVGGGTEARTTGRARTVLSFGPVDPIIGGA